MNKADLRFDDTVDGAYYYARSQRKSAVTSWVASVLCLIFATIIYRYVPAEGHDLDVLHLACKIIVGAAVFAAMIGVYWWRKNDSFVIYVDDKTFESYDPLFKSYSFSTELSEISKITHTWFSTSNRWEFKVLLNNGTSHQVSPNEGFDRERLYQAIEKFAPHIVIKDTFIFSKRPKIT